MRLEIQLALIAIVGLSPDVYSQAPDHARHRPTPPAQADSAFAALQKRGASVMGVDQYTSLHRFETLNDGGRISLERGTADSAGVRTIRDHLQGIAHAFAAGDFSASTAVHAQTVPGTDVMRARRASIRYEFRPLPTGGEVRIITRDAAALRAVHEFLAFQRADHRTKQ